MMLFENKFILQHQCLSWSKPHCIALCQSVDQQFHQLEQPRQLLYIHSTLAVNPTNNCTINKQTKQTTNKMRHFMGTSPAGYQLLN
jgi:hypothetical protein